MGKVHPKVDEAIETLNMRDNPTRRRLLRAPGWSARRVPRRRCSPRAVRPAARRAAAARQRQEPLPGGAQPEVLLREPRHHERVLHPHPVRARRRGGAARHTQRRCGAAPPTRPITEMVSAMNTGISAKAAGIAYCGDRLARDGHSGEERDERRHPGDQLQRRRDLHQRGAGDLHQPAGLRRAGALPVRAGHGQPDQDARAGRRGDRDLHRDPGNRQHPAPLRRRGVGARQQLPGDRRSRPARSTRSELSAEKAFLLGHKGHQGRVRRGLRVHREPGRGPRRGRPVRFRPAVSTPTRGRSPPCRAARSSSASSRTRTCRASCPPSTSTCTTCPAGSWRRRTPTPA